MISAVVLTKNEENNIKACLESLKWCDEIVVVDEYSVDKTTKLALKMGAEVYYNDSGSNFAFQRNFAMHLAKNDWVLFVDADERITPALRQEIYNLQFTIYNGFYLNRKDFFLGKWLNYGETASVRLLRLVKKGSGEWQRRVHETFRLTQGKASELKNPILHYPHPNISEFLESINIHTDLHSQVLFEGGKRTNLFEIIFYPIGKFCLNYFWRLGFLDGIQGLIMALMMSLHSFLARAKLYYKLNYKLNEKNK